MNKADRNVSRRKVIGGALAVTTMGMVPNLAVAEPKVRPPLFRSRDEVAEFDRFGDPHPLQEIVSLWRALPDPTIPLTWTSHADLVWTFALGHQSEGLQTTLASIPSPLAEVKIPHSILPADTPYWYRATAKLTTPCVLRITADDGAHLWVDGKRIPADGETFRLENGGSDLVVRVINKAMYGGLESVSSVPLADFDRNQKETSLRRRLDRAVQKLRRLVNPPKSALDAAWKALKDPSADKIGAFEMSLSPYPLILIAPTVHSVQPTEAVIAWETDVPCKPVLRYGLEDRCDLNSVVQSEDGRFHEAHLKGLKAEETVSYQIEGECPARFRALPEKGDIAFTVWGDPHIGFDRFHQNVSAMLREDVAFTVGVGDQVVDAWLKSPWEQFFDLAAPLVGTTPTFFMGGNHDYDGCFEDLVSTHHDKYARQNGKPWHAWTVGNCRFIALDPNVQFPTGVSAGTEQYQWFLTELERTEWSQASWRFLFIHQPPFSQGWTGYEGDIPIREMLEPLIEKHRIDFVISGHTHDYEHLTRAYGGQKCTFLIVGGAGGGLEEGPLSPEPVMEKVTRRHHYGIFRVKERSVSFQCIATDTLPLDQFTVDKDA